MKLKSANESSEKTRPEMNGSGQISEILSRPLPISVAMITLDGPEPRLVSADRSFAAIPVFSGQQISAVDQIFKLLGRPLIDATIPITNTQWRFEVADPRARFEAHWLPAYAADVPGNTGILVVVDITHVCDDLESARAQAEGIRSRLTDRTKDLERTNQDLEGFTFSVSHDLRAPLRAIMGFSKVLVEDHGRAVDAEMRQTLDRINAAATRMASIIEDLLTFSRLGRKDLVRRKIDLSEMASSIVQDLERRFPEREIQFEIQSGMVAQGDPTLVRMALENLFDNAVKFTSKTAGARIEFVALSPHTFVVKDNGAGFEPQYSEKLFRAFERLHSASEFPGTGIGLANVRRIVERHGGKVWAEGNPNEGAAFYFTL